jgi:hypothetical protein
MGRRTDLSVIHPPKVNREPYVWFRTKDLNFREPTRFPAVARLGLVYGSEESGSVSPSRARVLEAGRLNDIT